jgi:hypothetical protein
VMGSHTYATLGQYSPTVEVDWSDPTKRTILAGMVGVGAVMLPFAGPTAVPGNSTYVYTEELPSSITAAQVKGPWWTYADPKGVVVSSKQWSTIDPKTRDPIATNLELTFKNQPGVVTVKLNLNLPGTLPIAMNVNVVQVDVQPPKPVGLIKQEPFEPQQPYASDSKTNVSIPFQKGAKPTTALTVYGGNPALQWYADVSLIGPEDNNKAPILGVNQISVGFIQHVQLSQGSVDFKDGTSLVFSMAVNPQFYLDSENSPWCAPGPPPQARKGVLLGADASSKQITARDTPHADIPVVFPGTNAEAKMVNWQLVFTLDVGATTQAIPNSPVWAEAAAVQKNGKAGWSVNMSGDITKKLNDKKETIYSWNLIRGVTGTTPPNDWKPVMAPNEEKTGGPTANEAGEKAVWVQK